MLFRLKLGDCAATMLALPEGSIDLVCCDPPYGLEFMGNAWDRLDGVVLHDPSVVGGFQDGKGGNPYSRSRIRYGTFKGQKGDGVGNGGADFSTDGMGKGFKALPSYTGSPNPLCRKCKGSKRGNDREGFKVCRCAEPDFPNVGAAQGARITAWHVGWLSAAYHALRPGGEIKAFSGTRTFHRLGQGLEAAGFVDVRLEAWGYGSGFPKSHDVSKAIDKLKGLDRRVVGTKRGVRGADGTGSENEMPGKAVGVKQVACDVPVTAPASPEAELWDGWGTALKPAWEPVLVATKPR